MELIALIFPSDTLRAWPQHDSCPPARYHGELLQWARENGCRWDKQTCSFAAKSGHLHILQWAQANRCPSFVDTCAQAALHGHLEVLQFQIAAPFTGTCASSA
jgi:hypothetical protein